MIRSTLNITYILLRLVVNSAFCEQIGADKYTADAASAADAAVALCRASA